jgi:putative flippase GtrA
MRDIARPCADLEADDVTLQRPGRMSDSCSRNRLVSHWSGFRWQVWIVTTFLTFLTVGGLGYLVDVASFNALRSTQVLGAVDPSYARVLAVALAMVVTYLGNHLVTWRGRGRVDRRREVGLFVVFNLIGLGPSVVALLVSHDLLGFTSRLADNISANVIGVALGTLFRYWAYQHFVFVAAEPRKAAEDEDRMAA